MHHDQLVRRAAELLHDRNAIDADLARMIGRPVTAGHLGEWIASVVFDIELELSASAKGIDGRFRSGPLRGSTVNVKWYMKHQGLLDTTEHAALDYYLVLAGPPSPAGSSRGTTQPWCVDSVYLFDARQLRMEQLARGVKLGIASSVTKQQWLSAQVYPPTAASPLPLTREQTDLLKLFQSARPPAR
jgi:hypothetical protein